MKNRNGAAEDNFDAFFVEFRKTLFKLFVGIFFFYVLEPRTPLKRCDCCRKLDSASTPSSNPKLLQHSSFYIKITIGPGQKGIIIQGTKNIDHVPFLVSSFGLQLRTT